MKLLDLIKPKIIENGTIIAYSGSNYLVKIGNSTIKAFGAKGFQVNDNVVIGKVNDQYLILTKTSSFAKKIKTIRIQG